MKTFIFAVVSMTVAQCGTKLNEALTKRERDNALDIRDFMKTMENEKSSPAPSSSSGGFGSFLNSDFITGFESGIFLRAQPEQIKEYGCPKASV